MMSSMLALLLAATAAQGANPAAAARDAYTGCLRAFLEQSMSARTSPDEFDTAIDGQCAAEEAAFRSAVIQRERSYGGSQAQAEEDAELDVEDAKANFRDLYRATMEPEA